MKIKDNKQVSVVLATHNRAPFKKVKYNPIALTIAALNNQTRKPDKIIVIDDASNDYTARVKNYFESKICIEYLKLDKKVGSSISRNIGIQKSSDMDLAWIIDDDLIAMPTTLETALEAYEINNDKNIAALNLPVFFRSTIPTKNIPKEQIGTIIDGKINGNFNAIPEGIKQNELLPIQNLCGYSLINVKSALKTEGFPDFLRGNSYGEETILALRLADQGNLYFLPDIRSSGIHLRFGGNGRTELTGDDFEIHENIMLSEAVKEAAKVREDTGNRVDEGEWVRSKVGTYELYLGWTVTGSWETVISRLAEVYKDFVIDYDYTSHFYPTQRLSQDNRKKIFMNGLEDGLRMIKEHPLRNLSKKVIDYESLENQVLAEAFSL